jgi:hypothetical protein
MVRFLKINPKYRGGMIKGLKGLRPLIRRVGAGVRPPIGQFKQLSMNSTVRPAKVDSVSSGEGAKPVKRPLTKLKFLI